MGTDPDLGTVMYVQCGEFLEMPNDAKLGLVVGVGIVIAVAVVFFRKEAGAALPPTTNGPAASVGSAKEPANDRNAGRPTNAKRPGSAQGRVSQAIPAVRRHTVKEGDTLTGLAEQYSGDGAKSDVILRANRDVLQSADDLTPGTRLVIPNAPKKAAASDENKDSAANGD
jgi:hypothetical protein